MNTVQEIERAVEQLPPEDFSKLVEWIDQRRGKSVRDHSAFLNGYVSKDEGFTMTPLPGEIWLAPTHSRFTPSCDPEM